MATIKDQVRMPTEFGEAELFTFDGLSDSKEHVALVFGPLSPEKAPIVRIHSECLTGDVFGSRRCDCGPQIRTVLKQIAVQGGVLIYLRQEGRGIGLYNKIAAYKLQEAGVDTFEANRQLGFAEDERGFSVAAEMLKALNIRHVRLVSNNPDKVEQIRAAGILVREFIHHRTSVSKHNYQYLKAKQNKGHFLALDGEPIDEDQEGEAIHA